jgi:hypothetical protein
MPLLSILNEHHLLKQAVRLRPSAAAFRVRFGLEGNADTFAARAKMFEEMLEWGKECIIVPFISRAAHDEFADFCYTAVMLEYALLDQADRFEELATPADHALQGTIRDLRLFATVVLNQVVSLGYIMGMTDVKAFTAAVNDTILKNDAKTLDTHEVINGLVVRKPAASLLP